MTDFQVPRPRLANAISADVSSGARTITIRCSFCDAKHVHDWPTDLPDPGTRNAPCVAGAERTYRIIAFQQAWQAREARLQATAAGHKADYHRQMGIPLQETTR